MSKAVTIAPVRCCSGPPGPSGLLVTPRIEALGWSVACTPHREQCYSQQQQRELLQLPRAGWPQLLVLLKVLFNAKQSVSLIANIMIWIVNADSSAT